MIYEDVEPVLLSHHSIIYTKKDETGHFNRYFTFSVNGVEYKIEWWPNVVYLHLPNECFLIFDHFKVSDTWPNNSRANLQFYSVNNFTVFVLPIEKHTETAEQ